MSWGPVVGGLEGLVRFADTGGGVENDAGVCMPLPLGEVEADEESLFVDDERSWVMRVSLFEVPWGTGEMDLAMSLSLTDASRSGFSVRWVSSADIACVCWVWLDAWPPWSPAERE